MRVQNARRGAALGIAMSGSGLGVVFWGGVNRLLIDAYGWRTTMRIIGVVFFLFL